MAADGSEIAGDVIRVLHAEDEPQLAELTAEFIEREGSIEMTHAVDGTTALQKLESSTFECIVSDYDMPDMNGLELLDAVRERNADLPFVLFTGKGSEEIASDAISKGVTDYLQKGTGTDQYAVLANRIENAVESYRTERELDRRVDQLQESERRFRTLVSNLPGMVYRCQNERGWPMTFVSDGCEALTGYTAEALESDDVVWGEDVLVDAERDVLWETVQDALDAREAFQVEYEITTKEGEQKWVWERGRGVFDDDELLALEGVITDVTDEHELRENLEHERDITRRVFETSPVGIVVFDADDGSLRLVNDRAVELLGTTREALLDRAYDDDAWALTDGDGTPLSEDETAFRRLERQVETAALGDDVRIEDVRHSVRRGDGSRITVSINGSPLYDDDQVELLVFTIAPVES